MSEGGSNPLLAYFKYMDKYVKDLHKEAMQFADQAFAEQNKKNKSKAAFFFEKAFDLEKQAAEKSFSHSSSLTQIILHRSAATLAIDCNKLDEAEKLLARMLRQNISHQVFELDDLLKKVKRKQLIQNKKY